MTAVLVSTVAKVTSLRSQHSSTGTPTVPNQTPASDVPGGGGRGGGSNNVQLPSSVDLAAVTSILTPIQEELNDSAEEAMYPSPPINTPEALSPAPSIVLRQQKTRVRGLSVIGDRLAQLKLSTIKFPFSDTDGTASSRSIIDDYDLTGPAGLPNDDGKSEGSVEGRSSPARNPRIEEYIAFRPDPNHPYLIPLPPAASPLRRAKDSASSTKTVIDYDMMSESVILVPEEGVAEKSNWAEEVEDSVDRACLRLEQLARDEYAGDPSRSIEEYYIARLKQLLGGSKRTFPVVVDKQVRQE